MYMDTVSALPFYISTIIKGGELYIVVSGAYLKLPLRVLLSIFCLNYDSVVSIRRYIYIYTLCGSHLARIKE